jgi:putative peptidoglycan lipid II flippase
MASRILGLIREQLFAALLGAGYYADAFIVAFRIPNLLRDLFAEGALSAAFVPSFTLVEKEQGPQAAHRLAQRVTGALLLIVGGLVLLGIIFAKPLVIALAAGFAHEQGKVELTARLARLMMPFLFIVSFSAVLMGIHNARGRFSIPAFAPALFNVAAILIGIGLKLAGVSSEGAVVGWSIGTLLGGAAQLGIQVPSLLREGFSLLPSFRGLWHDEMLRRMTRMMAPATLGLAATQVNIFVNTQFASTQPGANAWLNYAFRLMYLPIGIFGVAIATVTASTLAHRAAERNIVGMKFSLHQGLRHVALLTIPSTAGLIILAEPIIALIFQHGRFTVADTQHTALALMGYVLGLYAYSGIKVVAPAFFALNQSRIPLLGSASAVLVNLSFNILAHPTMGYVGLALGTSLGALVNFAVLTIAFRRSCRRLVAEGYDAGRQQEDSAGQKAPAPRGSLLAHLARIIFASLLMTAVVWASMRAFDRAWLRLFGSPFTGGLGQQGLRVFFGIAVGVITYGVACRILGIVELREIMAAFRRRRRRRRSG